MKLTTQNIANAVAYRESMAKQFGTLHERMKYVVECMQRERVTMSIDLWNAIYDLETEVSYHEPQMPPCGRRTRGLRRHSGKTIGE